VTYLRIISPPSGLTGDIVSDGNSVTVLESGQPSSRHEVAHVLEKGISDEEVCELTFGNQAGVGMGTSLNPITACVSDAVTAIIFVVGSKETKKWQFMKRTVLPFVANELFSNIAEKDQQLGNNLYKAQVNLSAFELQDEIITDLLRPVNRGLSLAVTAEDGVIVHGLQSETIADEMDLRRLLIDACDNRASHTLPPGGSIDTTSAIFEFTLFQSEGGAVGPDGVSMEGGRECHSRLLVVEVPSTDPLVHGGAVDVRQLEGPNLHKSLLNFLEVTKKLNTPSRAAIAPYRSAKLTHFLSELMGGNSIVVALGLLANGEPRTTRKTLEVIGALSNALHYPVGGKELTDVLQGLLGKYRSMLMQLQDELLNRSIVYQDRESHEMTLEKQLLQLQRDIADGIKDKNLAIEDRERVYEMAELLKAKYATLMKEKLKQSEELAQSKEDNMLVAKSLMDKNIEFAAFREKTEKEIFDLSSQLMAARNHITELDATIADLQKNIEELQMQLVQKETAMQVLRDEIASLQNSVEETEKLLQTEKEKTIELGAELLTLVNRKDLLQKELDDLMEKSAALEEELKEKNTTEELLRQQLQTLTQAMKQKEEEMFELTKHSATVELEAKQSKLEADQLALAYKEKMLGKPATADSISTAKYEEMQASQRKSSKLIRDLERALRRVQADLEETKKQKTSMSRELNDVRDKYRKKLGNLMMREGAPAAGGGGEDSSMFHHKHAKLHHRTNSRQGRAAAAPEVEEDRGEGGRMKGLSKTPSEASLIAAENGQLKGSNNQEEKVDGNSALAPAAAVTTGAELQHQLLDTYTERELQQSQSLDRALAHSMAIKAAYRELYDKYRNTVELLEEQMAKAKIGVAKMQPLEEQFKFAEVDLTQSEAYLDELELRERTSLREKFELEQQAGVVQNERLSLILSTYQRNLEQTEKKLVASQQENIDLHIQIKQLIQNSSKLQHQIKEITAASKAATAFAATEAAAEATKAAKAAAEAEVAKAAAVQPEVAIEPAGGNAGAVISPEFQQQQQEQYATMFSALTDQIKDLKEQIVRQKLIANSRSNSEKQLQSLPNSSRDATTAATPAEATGDLTTENAEAIKVSKPPTPVAAIQTAAAEVLVPAPTQVRPPTPVMLADPAVADPALNPQGFQNMTDCLKYIAVLEKNAPQSAVTAQMQSAQQRITSLAMKNAALEEELSSYQAYMRDVVPQYKKQLQFLKQQLKIHLATAAAAPGTNAPGGGADGDGTNLKLPVIK